MATFRGKCRYINIPDMKHLGYRETISHAETVSAQKLVNGYTPGRLT